MKEQEFIKWLDGELTEEEYKKLLKDEKFKAYIRLSASLKKFKAPEFDTNSGLQKLNYQLKQKTEKPAGRLIKFKPASIIIGIAASLILLLSVVYIFTGNEQSGLIEIYATNKLEHYLPDSSLVILNAGSKVTYEADDWENYRSLILEGEGYFVVKKKSKFKVRTKFGMVQVLGTVFNVNARHALEVVCFEGIVNVQAENINQNLSARSGLSIKNGMLSLFQTDSNGPGWINGTIQFNKASLESIMQDLARTYDVEYQMVGEWPNGEFTGGFPTNNLDVALHSVTRPYNITFTVQDSVVILQYAIAN